MKNKQILSVILSIVLLVIITACGNNPDDPIIPPTTTVSNCKLTTVSIDGIVSILYEYNSNGKISKRSYPDGSMYVTYTYKNDSIIAMVYFIDSGVPTLGNLGKYVINASGNVIWSQWENNYITNYTYDANGYLKKEVTTYDNGNGLQTNTTDYTVVNGNYTGSVETYSSNSSSHSYTYEYYTDKDNKDSKITDPIGSTDIPVEKQSKNMLKKSNEYYSGVLNKTYNYTYEYNTIGYATKITEEYIPASTGSPSTSIYNLTYNCN